MIQNHQYHTTILSFLFFALSISTQAQKSRFENNYPLAGPTEAEAQIQDEYKQTVTAMLGAVQLMAMENTPTKRDDPEAFIKDDYKKDMEYMSNYAIELSTKIGTNYSNEIKKAVKSAKSNKYTEAMTTLENIGAIKGDEAETIFFIWKEYIYDKKNNAPWTDPKNINVTRVYRAMLTYVSQNYERPFGMQAEQGAVIADAAQALSNCLENPENLAWKGESKMNMRKEDELRRLASNVAYYNWRMHDRVSGRRAANINTDVIRHLQLSMYDVIRTIMEKKEDWKNDPVHGQNLQRLFSDTKVNGWSVNGDKANKKEKKEVAAAAKEEKEKK